MLPSTRSALHDQQGTHQTPNKTQLEDYACTPTGWYLNHEMQRPQKFQIITASTQTVSTTQYHAMLSKPRSSIELTAPELEPATRPECGRFLVVGLALSPEYLKMQGHDLSKVASKKQKPVGLAKPTDEDNIIDLTDEDRKHLLLVVTPLLPDSAKIKLGVLLAPERQLCTPFVIAARIVFYFDEFRDDTSNIVKRLANWNGLVSQAICSNSDSGPKTGKQHPFERAPDNTELDMDPEGAFTGETLMLARINRETQDPLDPKQMRGRLEAVDVDNTYKQPPGPGMCKFANAGEGCTVHDAEAMVVEYRERWPNVRGVTRDRVLALKWALKACGEDLEYTFILGFVAEGVHRMEALEPVQEGEERLWAVVVEVKAMIARTLGLSS